MPKDVLSFGYNSTIYQATPDERARIPGAEIAKVYRDIDPRSAVMTALELTIANKFFPGHFVPVKHAETVPSRDETRRDYSGSTQPVYNYTHRIYTPRMGIPDQHHVYTNHTDGRVFGKKDFSHDCRDCNEHRQFHRDNRLKEAITTLAMKSQPAGVFVQVADQSDYCLLEGKVMVFELAVFDPYYAHLFAEKDPQNDEVLHLLDLYERLDSITTQVPGRRTRLFMPDTPNVSKISF